MVKSLETTDKYSSVAKMIHFTSKAAPEVNDPVFRIPGSKFKDLDGRGL